LEERRSDAGRRVQETKKSELEEMLRSTQLALTLSVQWIKHLGDATEIEGINCRVKLLNPHRAELLLKN
jgi:hypothetical protein